MTSEPILLQRARQFDVEALAEIYDYYSPRIYRYAFRLLGDADSAEECVAETFGRFLSMLHERKGPERYLQAYLYRIAHNWVTDQYRRSPGTLPLESASSVADSTGLHQIASQHENQERIRAALNRLTPEQRQVIVLKYLEDLSNEEIAAAIAKPVGAVKSLQHRGLAALERILGAEEDGV